MTTQTPLSIRVVNAEQRLAVTVNGRPNLVSVAPWMTLLEMLRETLCLTGTRMGCGEGVCGSCTVLVDGMPVRSCLTLAAQVEGASVITVEGYAEDPDARALQKAFVDHHAAQCGFCTSGMLAVVRNYLEDDTVPDHGDEAAIRCALDAVICRCTGYQPIVAAVKALANIKSRTDRSARPRWARPRHADRSTGS
jgi:carbon-monoxide dehydrogenase small subunit